MVDHDGVLMMQRLLLAGTLGLSMARKAAAILEGRPDPEVPRPAPPDDPGPQNATGEKGTTSLRDPQGPEGAVLRAILDAANECLGHFDDRPPGERWCDALLCLLDLAAFAAELSPAASVTGSPCATSGLEAWLGTRHCVSCKGFALCNEPAVVAGRSPAPCLPLCSRCPGPAVVLAVAGHRPLARA